ncbi:MAG: transglycosylase SLT domain-containing protein, partial [Chloroflexota bacterium]|nr:transglycosylase SLT domain-containing protein [Chloroflexota bacterium]
PRTERAGRGERDSRRASRAPNIPEPPRNAANYSKAELIRLIEEAADYYDQPREDMLRVARCESELTPTAVNPRTGDSGLFQFNPDTWQTTPYRRYDIFDPRASAFAAGWMWSVGRRNEWVCQ